MSHLSIYLISISTVYFSWGGNIIHRTKFPSPSREKQSTYHIQMLWICYHYIGSSPENEGKEGRLTNDMARPDRGPRKLLNTYRSVRHQFLWQTLDTEKLHCRPCQPASMARQSWQIDVKVGHAHDKSLLVQDEKLNSQGWTALI